MSSPPDGLAGQATERPPAREPERGCAASRVKGSLAPRARRVITRL